MPTVCPLPGRDLGVHAPWYPHPTVSPLPGRALPGSRHPLPVDAGRGRDGPCSGWPALSLVAWGLHVGRGAPHMVVSSADQGRQSPVLVLVVGATGNKVPREEDRWSLHTDVQEADREQEPPSLSS